MIERILAVGLSLCLVCTLTPAVAFATSGSAGEGGSGADQVSQVAPIDDNKTSVSNEEDYFIQTPTDKEGTASAQTKVLGIVIDPLRFAEATEDWNYPSARAAVDDTVASPLTAILYQGDAANKPSGNYTYTWTVEPMTKGPDGILVGNGDTREIDSQTVTGHSGTFELAIPESLLNDGFLKDNSYYRFTIEVKDDTNNWVTSTEINVSTMSDYRHGIAIANGDEKLGVRAESFFYHPAMGTVQLIKGTDITNDADPVYQKLASEAANISSEPSITNPYNLTLGLDPGYGKGQQPFLYGTTVTLDLSDPNIPYAKDDDVWVYRLDPNTQNVQRFKGKVIELETTGGAPMMDADGNRRLAVSVWIPYEKYGFKEILNGETLKTVDLGTFAIGYKAGDVFRITSKASEGGQITPLNNASLQSIIKAKTFNVYPMIGYEYKDATVTINGTEKTYDPAWLSGNVLTIDPVELGINDGDIVVVTANFAKAALPEPPEDFQTNVKVIGEEGAVGTVEVWSNKPEWDDGSGNTKGTVSQGENKSFTCNSAFAVFLNFIPGTDPSSVVKSLKINGTEYEPAGNNYTIAALTEAQNIEVTFAPGMPPEVLEKSVSASIIGGHAALLDEASGKYEQDDGSAITSVTKKVPEGGFADFSIKKDANYTIDKAILKIGAATTDVTACVIESTTIDTISVPNIVSDCSLELSYKLKTLDLTLNFNNEGGSVTAGKSKLEAGEQTTLTITPNAGYTLGTFEIDSTDKMSELTPDPTTDDGPYYLIIVNGENGTTVTNPDGYKVIYVTGSSCVVDATFTADTPQPDKLVWVNTSVDGEGGTITPSMQVNPTDEVVIWFFPNDDKEIDFFTVTENGTTTTYAPTGTDAHPGYDNAKCKLTLGASANDRTVQVKYKDGTSPVAGKKKCQVTPIAQAGGSISPNEPTFIYVGESQQFTFIPEPGMVTSKLYVNGSEVTDTTLWDGGNTYNMEIPSTTTDDELEQTLRVTFKSETPLPDGTTFNVEVIPGAHGTASPLSSPNQAPGEKVPISIAPDSGYKVKSVQWAIVAADGTEGTKEDVTKDLVGGTSFTIYDLQASYKVYIEFEEDPNAPEVEKIYLDAKNLTLGSGATLSPEFGGLMFVKADGADHATADASFTLTLAEGYKLDDSATGETGIMIEVDGTTKHITPTKTADGLYTFTIPKEDVKADLKLTVKTATETPSTEKLVTRTVTITKHGNGEVSPSGFGNIVRVEAGKPQTFYFIPEATPTQYKLDAVYVDGELVSTTNYSYTIDAVNKDMTIEVLFTEGTPVPPVPQTWKVKAQTDGSGTLYPSAATVTNGGSLSISIDAPQGKKPRAWIVKNNASGEPDFTSAKGTWTELEIRGCTTILQNIKQNTGVKVEFEDATSVTYQTVNITCDPTKGEVSPSGTIQVRTGASQTFTVIPKEIPDSDPANTYIMEKVLVNGTVLPENQINRNNQTFTLKNIKEGTLVEVTFRERNASDPDISNITRYDIVGEVIEGAGTISPSKMTVAQGTGSDATRVSMTFLPQTGNVLYQVLDGTKDVTAEVIGNKGVYDFAVSEDHYITAKFKSKTPDKTEGEMCTIFASVDKDGNGGTISPITTGSSEIKVPYGGSMTFTLMPNKNMKVSRIIVYPANASIEKGNVIEDFKGSTYTLFDVKSDMGFHVVFASCPENEYVETVTHDIQATAGAKGSISPAGTIKVAEGGMGIFTVIPADGAKLSYLIVDHVNVPASDVTNGQYVFSNVKEDHSIHAVFCDESQAAADSASINVSYSAGGSISPDGGSKQVAAKVGEDITFDITPFFGYTLSSITVDGTTIDPRNAANTATYSWNAPKFTYKAIAAGNHSLQAEFTQLQAPDAPETPEYTSVTVQAGSGGTVSFNNGTSVIEAITSNLSISIIADEGKKIGLLKATYADGTVKDYSETECNTITKAGYVTFTPAQVNGGSGLSLRVEFKTASAEDLANGVKPPAAENISIINVAYFGGGVVNPHGMMKVVKGQEVKLFMVPNSGYEISKFTADGRSALADLGKSRVYTMTADGQDHSYETTFTSTAAKRDYYEVKATTNDANQGEVSPASQTVPAGESATVNFFPKAGYHLEKIQIGSNEPIPYTSPYYTIGSVTEDMTIKAIYATGETWMINGIDVKIEVVGGNGTVSPTQVKVPAGSSQNIYFKPNDGYEIDYITFNGETVRPGPGTYVYPIKPEIGKDNKVIVGFKRADTVKGDLDVNVSVNVTPVVNFRPSGSTETDTSATGGTVSPLSRTVPYGGSASFFILPDDGYTVQEVLVDGASNEFWGVENDGTIHKEIVNGVVTVTRTAAANNADLRGKTAAAGVYKAGATTESAVYRGGAHMRTVADVTLNENGDFYSVYETVIPSVQRDVTVTVIFRKIIEKNYTYHETGVHTLTATGTGGGIVSPLGEMKMPEGQTQSIMIKPLTGYYVESIMKTENGKTTEITDELVGSELKFTMGKNDVQIKATFKLNAEKGNSKVTVDVDGSSFTYKGNPLTPGTDLTINPPLTDPVTGKPTEFTRGEKQLFMFDAKDPATGNPLVIESITYNGKPVPFIPGSTYAEIDMSASGPLEVTFREADTSKGEPIVPSGMCTVTASVNGTGGTVSPASAPVMMGGTHSITITPDDDTYVVKYLIDKAKDADGNWQDKLVDPSEYPDFIYKITDITADHQIEVAFAKTVRVYTNWNNEGGYMTPNAAPGEYLKIIPENNLGFVVAPYKGWELTEFAKKTSEDGVEDMTAIGELVDGGADQIASDVGMMSRARAVKNAVPPAQNEFNYYKRYDQAKITAPTTYLRAKFAKQPGEMYYKISAFVNRDCIGRGTVEPTYMEVPAGATPAVTFKAMPNYAVGLVQVNGKAVKIQGDRNQYIFDPVYEDKSLEVWFINPGDPYDPIQRVIRKLQALAQTGDLNGPIIGGLIAIAVIAGGITLFSYVRRRKQ